LGGTTHPVVVDRIELGTYMIAPALAGGQVDLIGGKKELLGDFWYSLEGTGLEISEIDEGIRAKRVKEKIRAVDVKTGVYPGFATDLQAQFMALMCLADGTSFLEETLFENRFMHAPELMRMGAKVDIHGGTAKVQGVSKLKGAPVMATDLRASVSLILAGLAAEGETKVSRVYHLDRGYENLVTKLSDVGANIERISD
jgi:UDP-N-acetylglucosamine 1-carboxyvinyltransferase